MNVEFTFGDRSLLVKHASSLDVDDVTFLFDTFEALLNEQGFELAHERSFEPLEEQECFDLLLSGIESQLAALKACRAVFAAFGNAHGEPEHVCHTPEPADGPF